MNLKKILENSEKESSVPCRVDFGGTLDISTFYLPLAHLGPATFNIALDMRTHVRLSPWTSGRIKISSRGFESLDLNRQEIGFDHPLGLMCAIAKYFNVHGVHIHIDSTSPPRSALGGSSSAAVAVIAALYSALDKPVHPESIAWLAHYIESSVAGVPCGVQDQTAAAFGGVNLWEWTMGLTGPGFNQIPLYQDTEETDGFNRNILVAYCGIPHVSKDINKQWVEAFVRGEAIHIFEKIAQITKEFFRALQGKNYGLAGELMIQETLLRLELTPEVLDKTGKKLFERAKELNCGARFAGAGGGGCVWAVGGKDQIKDLSLSWQRSLESVDGGEILDTKIDLKGILVP